jgi:HAD superfamily phosphoserine phosphatase-like hydrolase
VPLDLRGLVAFDLDGTLLRGATVCELIAESLGRLDEMKRFEALSTPEEIARARAEMAAWYGVLPRHALCASLERAEWAPGAHEAAARLRSAGVEVVIASITWEFAAQWLGRQIGVTRVLGTRLSDDGHVTHVWPADKAVWLRGLVSELGLPLARTAAVGDSPSDAELLGAAARRYYVGAEPPRDLSDVVHRPAGDLAAIANDLLEGWQADSAAALPLEIEPEPAT